MGNTFPMVISIPIQPVTSLRFVYPITGRRHQLRRILVRSRLLSAILDGSDSFALFLIRLSIAVVNDPMHAVPTAFTGGLASKQLNGGLAIYMVTW